MAIGDLKSIRFDPSEVMYFANQIKDERQNLICVREAEENHNYVDTVYTGSFDSYALFPTERADTVIVSVKPSGGLPLQLLKVTCKDYEPAKVTKIETDKFPHLESALSQAPVNLLFTCFTDKDEPKFYYLNQCADKRPKVQFKVVSESKVSLTPAKVSALVEKLNANLRKAKFLEFKRQVIKHKKPLVELI